MAGMFETRPDAGRPNFPVDPRSVKLAGGAQTRTAHCNFVMDGTGRTCGMTSA